MIGLKNHQFVVQNSIEGRQIKFRDLPEEAQLAIIVYMAGAGWLMLHENKEDLREKRELYVKEYGRKTFGLARLPMKAIKEELLNRAKARGTPFKSFEEYQKQYPASQIEKHPTGSVWPCIMSQFDDELFEDGWHRFHHYVRSGLTVIPVIYFPRPACSMKRNRKSRKREMHDKTPLPSGSA